jgi:hypothetical protein
MRSHRSRIHGLPAAAVLVLCACSTPRIEPVVPLATQAVPAAVATAAAASPAGGIGVAKPERIGGDPVIQAARAPLPWAASLTYSAEGPAPINLSSVPVGAYVPNTKIERGWGQGAKARRIPGPLPAEEVERLREAAKLLAPNSRIQGATPQRIAGTKAPSAGIGFDAIDYTECCGGGGNVPPDPDIAVGPNHIIAIVNVAFKIFDKSGNLLAGPTTLASFFAGTPGCSAAGTFDPVLAYDESTDRFIIGVDGNGTDFCVAATQTGDPTGTWNRYGFATNFAGAFFDYPHMGVGRDALYMGANQFGGSLPGGFEGRVWAMDKAAMYAGTPLTVVTKTTTAANSTPQPMKLHGFSAGTWPTSGPHYIMTEVYDGANHSVWSWTDPFGANVFVKQPNLNLAAFTGVPGGMPVDVPQQGGLPIQGNDFRGLDTEYRNGYIWMTNTISCNPGGGTVNCLRWAKIDPAANTIVDAGVFASTGQFRTFPDLAVNQCGDMAIGYTKSSTAMFPSIFVNGRENGDAAGMLQTEVQLKAGTIAYSAFDTAPRRWGDYTGMTVDPDGKTFWYLGEYSKDTGTTQGRWGTYIGSFSFPSCGGEPVFTLGAPVPGTAGVVNTFAVSSATPGSPLTLFYGTRTGAGSVTVPGCPTPISVGMTRPRQLTQGTADAGGAATLQGRLGRLLRDRNVTFQAIDGSACAASPPVTVMIR